MIVTRKLLNVTREELSVRRNEFGGQGKSCL